MSASFTPSHNNFKDTCAKFLRILCNDKDMSRARSFLAEDCTLIHEDFPPIHGAGNFIQGWSQNLLNMPDYYKTIVDIVCELEEEGGAILWVYSQINGIHGKDGPVTDSVDMMRFNREGLFVYSKDVQRSCNGEGTTLSVKTTWGEKYVSNVEDLNLERVADSIQHQEDISDA